MNYSRKLKSAIKSRASRLAAMLGVKSELFFPHLRHADAFALYPAEDGPVCASGLPIPPQRLWTGYGSAEVFLESGKQNTDKVLELVAQSGFELSPGKRVLELGCASARMLRHLATQASTCEIWGTDLSAEHIYWCKQNLSPPFHFATTTTIPHLPFEDRYFDLIFCGSVFTHIDDLADAWLLELRRCLSPEGRICLTIHDRHTIELLEGLLREHWLAKRVKEFEVYHQGKEKADMIVVGRSAASQVFYNIEYFKRHTGVLFNVHSTTEEAYGHQTAIVLSKK